MRILTVSAHYPPNFVSGGTLQPQRISRGLAALGHEVSVFAGWLGDREPLETWTDTDETGLPVTWVVSTPWIGWGDDLNWHNPPVTDLFRAHLDQVQPDIVHIHSLQSLGAGLVAAAAASGARVVVTMHDFWWLCARQFLVDTEMVPCSLVVHAGACACESGIERRDQRLAGLRTLLAPADLVLAPSRSATEVLAANGVAPGRLEVDENGLPGARSHSAPVTDEVDPEPPLASADGVVRFVYTGGPNPMKGSAVLVEAARRLADEPGWHLTAFGLADHLTDTGGDISGLPLSVEDPFEPEDLATVLAAHDVFVLPSVMRETYSLATREALGAGLPVLTTDTLGPEEVVVHGDNGLVVPAGDPAALAAAMRRLIRDPDELARVRAGARRPVATRSIDDQVEGLATRFEQLLANPGPGPGPGRGRGREVAVALPWNLRSVVFVCGIEGAPLRYRAHLPAEALAGVGVRAEVRHYRDPDLLGLCGQADVVVFYRVPATRQILELIDALHSAGIPCAFDVDDLIFDPDIRDEIPALRILPPDEARLWLEGVNRYRTTLEACDAYIGSTDALVEHAAKVTGLPTHRFANGVGRLLATQADHELRRDRRPGPLRVGYFSGTTTHDEDWFHIEGAVLAVLARHPGTELWLGGHLPESPALHGLGPTLVRLPFVPWLELPGLLRDLDVNLAPLAPGSRFNESKSAIKWLEAALVATPTVASATQPFREAILDGDTGLLADDPDEWIARIDELLTDTATRTRIGAQARRRALLEWSPERQGERYAAILGAVVAAGPTPRRATSTWEPVALDEPALAVTIEAYDPRAAGPDAIATGAPTAAPDDDGATHLFPVTTREQQLLRMIRRARSLQYRARTSIATDGVTTTAGKAARKLSAKASARRPH